MSEISELVREIYEELGLKEKRKLVIKKTNKCDTRALKKGEELKIEDVQEDTEKHIAAVYGACSLIANELKLQASKHDHTKLDEYLPIFTRALQTGFQDDKFAELNWFKLHTHLERHHLNDYVPEDVNLIDVIEMICDCVCAGKARTGKVYPIVISNEILQKAVENTTKFLIENIEVEDSKNE